MLSPRQQRGISLLESLMAMAVLASALLALLNGQLLGHASQRDGVHRSQALRLIDDLAERLRSHGDGALTLAGLLLDADAASEGPDCEALACDAETFVRADVAAWKRAVERTLPSGRARFLLPSAGNAETGGLDVMLAWRPGDVELARTAPGIDVQPDSRDAVNDDALDRCPAPLACQVGHVDL